MKNKQSNPLTSFFAAAPRRSRYPLHRVLQDLLLRRDVRLDDAHGIPLPPVMGPGDRGNVAALAYPACSLCGHHPNL